jgi:AcrR family transcriptional regulator
MARPGDPNARIDLLSAAEAVFVERGLDQTKVEDITERAGRSKGSFYLHFASKEEAFKHVVEGLVARLSAFLDREAARDLGAIGSLDELFDVWTASGVEMFEFVWQNRGVMGLVLRGGLSASYAYLMDEFADRVRRFIRDALEKGVARGLYRSDLDLDLASLALAGAYDRIARQVCEAERRPDLAKMLRALDSALLGGIGSDEMRAYLTKKSGTKQPKPKSKSVP